MTKKFAIIMASLGVLSAPANALTLDQRLHDLPTLEYGFCALAMADKAVTIYNLDHGAHESNPIYGRNPDKAALIGGGVAACLVHAGVTSMLQDHAPRWVKPFEIVSIGFQGGIVGLNVKVAFGLKR